ncbi:MAG TPA: MlaD family protein [Gemmatimonadaceae bacterium]|jgi:phospholipid/cholesterol/gamma-HCH transport system substrate-binding protein|nr:MlaD family protein [Gemmatimonadaceae bacterium]
MKRRDEVLVGIFLTVAAAIALLGTLWLVRGGLSSGYPLHSRFAWGQNLKPGQQVLLAGVAVGAVADVKLRDDGFLDVVLRVNDDVKVPRNSVASVKPVGIFGDAAIALTPKGPSKQSFSPGDTVPVGPADTDIQAIMNRVDSIGATVQTMTKAINADLVASGGIKDMRRSLASAAEMTQAAARLSIQLNAIAAEQNRNLTATMASFRRAASAVDSAKIDSTMRNFQTSSASLTRIAANLDSTSRHANALIAGIERGEGNAGKLLRDTLLYNDLRKVVGQVDSVLVDLKANPRKYINLSIF